MSLPEFEGVNQRTGISSAPEDAFVELFAQAFGLEKVQLLSYDHPAEDFTAPSATSITRS